MRAPGERRLVKTVVECVADCALPFLDGFATKRTSLREWVVRISDDQWYDMTGGEYAALIQGARASGAYEAKIGALTPAMIIIMIIVAFLPPLFIFWSIGLYFAIKLSKEDRLLLTDAEIIQGRRRITSFAVKRTTLVSLKAVHVRTSTEMLDWLDRLFGYGTVAATREGHIAAVMTATDVRKPGAFVAEWRKRSAKVQHAEPISDTPS